MKGINFLIILATACASNVQKLSPEEQLNKNVEDCYDKSQSAHNLKSGKIKYLLTFNTEGKIKSIKISESQFTNDPAFETCTIEALKGKVIVPPTAGRESMMWQEYQFGLTRKQM